MAQNHPHHHQQPKRKKWTEEEERTLIEKYSHLSSDGTLSRLRTREKKFRPIAAHVNSVHHVADPVTFPFQWTWKDVSTKVQNMRHQYLLVKQKILVSGLEFRWEEGDSYWPNFIFYKQVFGDHPLPTPVPSPSPNSDLNGIRISEGDGDGDLGLGFECECGPPDGDEDRFDYDDVIRAPAAAEAEPLSASAQRKKRKRRKERRAWDFLERLKEREVRMEEKEREWEERLRRRREEEREWEDRMEMRRVDWRKRMEGMMTQHRVDMEQMQARMIQDQQSAVSHLLGIVSQWGGVHGSLGDAVVIANHHQQQHHHAYVSQMMHGFHGVNGIVDAENRVGDDSQEDQFIVDG